MEVYILNNKELMVDKVIPNIVYIVKNLAQVFESSPESDGCMKIYDEIDDITNEEWYQIFSKNNWKAFETIDYDAEEDKIIIPEDDMEGALAFQAIYESAAVSIIDKVCGDLYNDGLVDVTVGKDGEFFYSLNEQGKEFARKNNIKG